MQRVFWVGNHCNDPGDGGGSLDQIEEEMDSEHHYGATE